MLCVCEHATQEHPCRSLRFAPGWLGASLKDMGELDSAVVCCRLSNDTDIRLALPPICQTSLFTLSTTGPSTGEGACNVFRALEECKGKVFATQKARAWQPTRQTPKHREPHTKYSAAPHVLPSALRLVDQKSCDWGITETAGARLGAVSKYL